VKAKGIPYGKITTPAEWGLVARAKRVADGFKQAQAAGFMGVGIRFLSELERGKPTAELGKALQVLHRLGLEVWIVPRGLRPPVENWDSHGK
jgi:HTH-type transcriptional regulator/antitoxin HipB